MPFSSLASTASSSNARRVSRASWSNASKAWDDFKDSFDRINDVDAVSDDGGVLYSSGMMIYFQLKLKNLMGHILLLTCLLMELLMLRSFQVMCIIKKFLLM